MVRTIDHSFCLQLVIIYSTRPASFIQFFKTHSWPTVYLARCILAVVLNLMRNPTVLSLAF